eukprot:scaffold120867_cov37-Attheya_sp.AAC.1
MNAIELFSTNGSKLTPDVGTGQQQAQHTSSPIQCSSPFQPSVFISINEAQQSDHVKRQQSE